MTGAAQLTPPATAAANGHDRRRQATRRELMACARALFGERSYSAVTLADIAGAAGVTRQTVYSHFDSKLGLVRALAEPMLAEASAQDEALAAAVPLTDADVRRWLDARIVLLRDNLGVVRILWQANAAEPDSLASEFARHGALIRLLAAAHPGFAQAVDGQGAPEFDAKARLLLERAEAVCLNIARGWPGQRDTALNLVTHEFVSFAQGAPLFQY